MENNKKKINPLFAFILGIFLAAGTVYAYSYFADTVGFTSNKGLKSTNVQDAIDEVYADVVDYNSLKNERDKYYNISILQSSNRKAIFKQNVNYTTLTYEVDFHGSEGSSSVCTAADNSNQCSFTISHNQGAPNSTGRWVSPIKQGTYYMYSDYDATLVSYACVYKVTAKVEDSGSYLTVRLYRDTIRLVDNGYSGSTTPDESFCSAHAEQMFNKDAFTLSTTYLNNLELNDVTHTEN